MQLAIENAFRCIAAASGRKSVVIHDRALLDISAYLPDSMWAELITVQGLTSEHLHGRYDAVVHLVTAADGAEEFYTTGLLHVCAPTRCRDLGRRGCASSTAATTTPAPRPECAEMLTSTPANRLASLTRLVFSDHAATNAARTETAAEARDLDRKVLQAWENHHRQLVIGNAYNGGFDEKLAHLAREVLAVCREIE